MEEKSNFLVILLIIAIISIGLGGYIVYEKKINSSVSLDSKEVEKKQIVQDKEIKEKKEEEIKKEEKVNSTFSLIDEAGIAYVEGYVEKEHRSGTMYFSDEGDVDYLLFHIVNTDSNDFLKWIDNSKGNSFVGDKAIGIGCINDNIIEYYNSSDEKEDAQYRISKNDSEKIINSTKDNLVKLKLERKVYTGGSGTPMCYSHITNINVIE